VCLDQNDDLFGILTHQLCALDDIRRKYFPRPHDLLIITSSIDPWDGNMEHAPDNHFSASIYRQETFGPQENPITSDVHPTYHGFIFLKNGAEFVDDEFAIFADIVVWFLLNRLLRPDMC
jgi:hypothetical protein